VDLCQESRHLCYGFFGKLLCKTDRGKVPQCAMHSLAVVIKLNVLVDGHVGLFRCFKAWITVNAFSKYCAKTRCRRYRNSFLDGSCWITYLRHLIDQRILWMCIGTRDPNDGANPDQIVWQCKQLLKHPAPS